MTNIEATLWESKRTDETKGVEDVLHQAGFANVAAYRYNPAAIRVRVIDQRFESLSTAQRDAMVEPILERLPERTQGDILTLHTFAPSELEGPPASRESFANWEFDHPSPSLL